MTKNAGTMVLPSLTAAALWTHEVTGQLNDGYWENSTPRDHYSFWCSLDVTVEHAHDPHVLVRSERPKRNRYNLRALLKVDEVRDRMVRLGRMALALARLGLTMDHTHAYVACDMPEAYGDFVRQKALVLSTSKHQYEVDYWSAVSDEVATVYYTQPDVACYGLKQMKADLELIKAAMMTTQV